MTTINTLMKKIATRWKGTIMAAPTEVDVLRRIVDFLPSAGDGLTARTDRAIVHLVHVEGLLRQAKAELARAARQDLDDILDEWTDEEILAAYNKDIKQKMRKGIHD